MAKTIIKPSKSKTKGDGTPFYLSKARLKGYRTLKDCSIDFNPSLNIIIGKNGVGKTNFLSLLTKALSNDLDNEFFLEIQFSIIGRNEYIVKAKRKPGKINGTRKLDGTHFIGNDLNVKILEDDHLIENNGFSPFAHYQPQFIVHNIPKNHLFFKSSLSFSIDFSQPPGLNELQKKMVEEDSYFSKAILDLLISRDYDRYKKLDKSFLIDDLKTFLAELNSLVSKYTEVSTFRFKESLEFSFSSSKDSIHISNLQLEFYVGNDWLLFEQLSDGTKRLIYIITEIGLQSHFFFNGKLRGWSDSFTNRIILLEEPELSIHPHLLSSLMDFLREQAQNKQIIITTHSPQVLDILNKDELDKIIIVSSDIEKGTQMRHLAKAEQEKAKKYLETTGFISDYWRLSNLEK